jgi:hypothetical protein
MNAKELVNTFYQPLGFLNCQVSSGKMWDYAKARAIEWCDAFIKEFEQLHKPEYTTFITQYAKFKEGTTDIEVEAETCDGYEKLSLFKELKAEIEKL